MTEIGQICFSISLYLARLELSYREDLRSTTAEYMYLIIGELD
jgi:hypothetical protein